MSSRIETAAAATASRNNAPVKKETPNPVRVVGFDAERFQAPFALRCGALLIDYLLLVSAPAVTFLMASSRGLSGVKLWRDPSLSVGWLIALLVLVTNFIILPVVLGRTIGKFATGLRVVAQDGSNPTFVAAALRHLVGYPLTLLTGGLGFAFAAFNRKGRALHDFVGGTIVVRASRRIQRTKTLAK
ncbi:MAG TPA: RDD family protein [Pyrinomonadaceae bacterium]|jgi:uncharacterized RDD family membrane protein YckC